MTALRESRACRVHLISSVTPTWIKDTFFSCLISLGKAIVLPALWLFYICSTFSSQSACDSQHTHTSVKLCFFSRNSFSKYFVRGKRPQVSSFYICPRSDCNLKSCNQLSKKWKQWVANSSKPGSK